MRIFQCMAAVALALILATSLAPASAVDSIDSPASGRLVIGPDPYCVNESAQVFTCTELDFGIGYGGNDATSATVMFKAIPSGAVIYRDYAGCAGVAEMSCSIDLSSTLPAGRYEFAATVSTPGEWSCSRYNPDGCSWLSGGTKKYDWRFAYDGHSMSTFNEYVAPSTGFKRIPGTPLAKKTRGEFIVRGRVVATAETASFGLTNASAHRRVSLYRRALHGGRWVRVDRTHAHKNGKFRLQGAAPGGKTYRWYVWMPKRGTSPAFVGQTVRA